MMQGMTVKQRGGLILIVAGFCLMVIGSGNMR